MSPWLALLYGLYPGLFTATSLDTAEPLAYGLIALAVYLLEFGGEARIVLAGITFALAGLTRETTLIFPVVYAAAIVLGLAAGTAGWKVRHAWRDALALLGLAVVPFIAYKVFLTRWPARRA